MPLDPHRPAWFEKLNHINPQQAGHTARLIKLAGRSAICSICGDEESKAYEMLDGELTLRLCDGCRVMQKNQFGLILIYCNPAA